MKSGLIVSIFVTLALCFYGCESAALEEPQEDSTIVDLSEETDTTDGATVDQSDGSYVSGEMCYVKGIVYGSIYYTDEYSRFEMGNP